jgi:raffinose/stachyose/melibiose transport system permease protein
MKLQTPLATTKTALYGVLFVNAWQSVAMPTIILLAGLQSIPSDLFESAVIDGATKLQVFRYITLPYLLPTLTINMILSFKGGITSFDYAYAMTNGGPNRATELISLMIYNDGFKDSNFALASAKAVVLFVIIAALSLIQIKFSNSRKVGA